MTNHRWGVFVGGYDGNTKSGGNTLLMLNGMKTFCMLMRHCTLDLACRMHLSDYMIEHLEQ